MRLDLAVSRAFGLSRRAAREAVRAGRVEVERERSDEPGLEVSEEAKLEFHRSRPAQYRVRTQLSVLAEDKEFLIVDKPAGLLTLPTEAQEEETLLSRASFYLRRRYRRSAYLGVVHRLDKETSGALVFARTRNALRFFQEQFRLRKIEREYLAIVQGSLPAEGTFRAGLVRDAGQGRRGIARPGQPGRKAITRYRVLERFRAATLVSIQLETGRTHQVRIHFAAAGHPLLGDRVYRRRTEGPPVLDLPRQMLHARLLGFPHPRSGLPVRASSPIPEDFTSALSTLRQEARAQKRKRAGSAPPPKATLKLPRRR